METSRYPRIQTAPGVSVEKAGTVSALHLEGSSPVAWADAPAGTTDDDVRLIARMAGKGTRAE